MKKLMIAVAAAAMIGGVYADTAYKFSASLKTTKGKDGNEKVTFNLGRNSDGEFWYQSEEFKALPDSYKTTKKVGGSVVKTLTADAKKDFGVLTALKIEELAETYNKKSDNKWCETIKVTVPGCYRVAGNKKISDVVAGDFCCSGLASVNEDGGVTVDAELSQYFGSLAATKASKAELFAAVADEESGFEGYLAGQGKVGKVLDSEDLDEEIRGVTSISGNIVGVLPAPKCEYCCTDPQASVAFTCDEELVGGSDLETAAYGTFKLAYDKKATKALAADDED